VKSIFLRNAGFLIILFILLFTAGGCEKESSFGSDRIVIGLSSDITSFNPLFSFSVDEGIISELLYLNLVDFTWDDEKGNITPEPMLAKNWQWNGDSSSITFELRDDVYWSDGRKFYSEDVVFSFDIYSDPVVQSRQYGTFEDFYTDDENYIDIEKTFEVIDSFKVKINFLPGSTPTLPEITFPIIPKHIFEAIERKDIATSEENFKPVTNGPFLFSGWDKNQSIRLKANRDSFLHNPNGLDEIIFKIVPEYSSRLTQLKKGEIDLAELIRTEDINELKEVEHLRIVPQRGREYDYAAWSNIDHELYRTTGEIKPHKLFGNAAVRKALTYSMNRKEILDEYLLGYAQLSAGPVSPIFKEAVDSDLKPYEYNPAKAKSLLESEGWRDIDNDGTLEKGNLEFKFKLFVPSGNPRRSYAATIVKNNLKQVGINVTIESTELGVLIDNMYEKNMDAWMIGWYVTIPVELKFLWYSDLAKSPYNFVSYQNKKADRVLDEISKERNPEKLNNLYKQFQKIIHEDEPVTFLYWVDNIVVHNRRIKNLNVNPLGAVHHCWNWSVRE
jgi:peptide/nickel transport system substrate-binding protein